MSIGWKVKLLQLPPLNINAIAWHLWCTTLNGWVHSLLSRIERSSWHDAPPKWGRTKNFPGNWPPKFCEWDMGVNVHLTFYICFILAEGHTNCSFQRLILSSVKHYLGQCWRRSLLHFIECVCLFVFFISLFLYQWEHLHILVWYSKLCSKVCLEGSNTFLLASNDLGSCKAQLRVYWKYQSYRN